MTVPEIASAVRTNIMLVELNLDGTIGGSYFSLLYLVTGLNKTQYKTTVVFESPNTLVPRFQAAGIDTRVMTPRIPARTKFKLLRPFVRVFNFTNSKLHSAKVIRRCIRLLKEEKIDLLHLNNSVSGGHEWMIAANKLGIPCVTHERGLGTEYSPTAHRLGAKLAAVFCISKAVEQNLKSQGLGNLPLVIVHNGLDPNAMQVTKREEEVRLQYKIDASRRLIGIVGNIQRWKGQDVVIDAMAQLQNEFPNLVCMLIGDVSPHDPNDIAFNKHLQELIRQHRLEDRLILTGFRLDVTNHINILEILIHASVTPEPFGRVLLEGMALYKPVVASRAGGVEEIINDGVTGLLYTPGNSTELAASLRRLLNNEQERLAMGIAGYERLVSDFGIEKNVKTTENMYRSILAEKQ